ncbi:hypothetical protein PRK78_005294 [Emydomyces testavorans]|uniref:Uncharacterized protein n=1 Tax=Emydomyces testavorans TaxID=2070801 RepID=A0AAF0DJA1_9EURO|nr:hypothetical protein PRK78_005294 [Emydomyces testavorans]
MSSANQPSPIGPVPSSGLNLETNCLYIVLSERGDFLTFHWALYLATAPRSGIIYHLINPGGVWTYEKKISQTLVDSRSLSLVLKIANMDPKCWGLMEQCLAAIPIQYSTRFREDITCRVWLKEAIYDLDQSGLIHILTSVLDIEQEATSNALTAKTRSVRLVENSKYTQGDKF